MGDVMVRITLVRCRRAQGTLASGGFTLMELLIVMVIIGILTAIAMPNYSEYIARGNRSDAKGQLLQVAQWLERVRTEGNSYIPAGGAVLPQGFATSPAGATAAAKKYDITAPVWTATTYTLTAAPANSMATDRCGTFQLDQTGLRSLPNGANMADCWGR